MYAALIVYKRYKGTCTPGYTCTVVHKGEGGCMVKSETHQDEMLRPLFVNTR